MLIKWKIRAILNEIKITVGEFISDVIYTVRCLLYGILTIVYGIGILCFIISFYYMYKYFMTDDVNVLKNGIILFVVPIIVAIVREFVRPEGRE